MAGIVEYPPILTNNAQQDNYNLREYIIRNIERMQQQITGSGGSVFVEGGDVYVTINGGTMTLQQYIQENILMDGAIVNVTVNANIETNAQLQAKTVTITANGSQVIEPDEGKDGLSSVSITVNVPTGEPSGTIQLTENGTVNVANYEYAEVDVQPALQSKTVTITNNGTQTITPSTGKDGLSSVTITVNVPTGVNLQAKTASPSSSQQEITPDTGFDGLSKVTVAAAPLQTRTVTPTAAAQQIEKSSNSYYGLQRVNINGDANLLPGNIRNGVSIFGVAGSYSPSFNLQSKNVTPSGSAQTIVPDSGYDGLGQVIVAAIQTQTKSCTPSASQQQITPASGKYLTKVTVAGDSDLIASNIKKDVNIFGVIGTYEPGAITGSLIDITCSSNIDEVTATVNGHTYTAMLNTTTHKAYITIPYTDTTAARTCTLKGYINGSQKASATVSMAAGIGYYTATLSSSEWLFKNGTWYGVDSHEWIRLAPSTYAGRINVTESSSGITLALASQTGGSTRYAWEYLSPKLSNRGYSQLEIVVASIATSDTVNVYCGTALSSESPTGRALSVGTNTISIPADEFYLEFYMNDWNTRTPNTAVISSMRFV